MVISEDDPDLLTFARAIEATPAQATHIVREIVNGRAYLHLADAPWWRPRHVGVVPGATPLAPRKIIRRYTLPGLVWAISNAKARRELLHRGIKRDLAERG